MIKKANMFDLFIGALLILLGIFVWANPMEILIAVSLYIGLAFLVIGGLYVVKYFDHGATSYLTFGIIDMIVGFIMILNIPLVATSLPIILGFWILFNSIIQITNAIDYKKLGLSIWSYELMAGIVGILFSLIILTHPSIGAATIAIIMGIYLVVFGLEKIYEYFLLKNLEK